MRFIKSKQAVLDYAINWTDYLRGSDIETSQWNVVTDTSLDDNPLKIDDTQYNEKRTLAIVSGGEVDKEYKLENIIQYVYENKTLTDKRGIVIKINN